MNAFLGIDIGTSGTKTLAIDPDGQDPRRLAEDLPVPRAQAALE